MKKYLITILLTVVLQAGSVNVRAEDIKLPKVTDYKSMPLMETLKRRGSSREFSNKSLDMKTLSELLWAAFGINRPEQGKRTAPSAFNMQEIDIYAVLEKGVYLYDPRENSLIEVSDKDLRVYTGIQKYVKSAPLNLVYVVDYKKMERVKDDMDKLMYASTDVGFIGQNVYLYCAAKGLVCVFRSSMEKKSFSKKIKLKSSQKVLYAQTVGYPVSRD